MVQVDPAERGHRRRGVGIDLVLGGNVSTDGNRSVRKVVSDLLRTVAVDVDDDHARTLRCEPLRAGAADPAGSAGDHRHLPVKPKAGHELTAPITAAALPRGLPGCGKRPRVPGS